jgi:hypothetical protein
VGYDFEQTFACPEISGQDSDEQENDEDIQRCVIRLKCWRDGGAESRGSCCGQVRNKVGLASILSKQDPRFRIGVGYGVPGDALRRDAECGNKESGNIVVNAFHVPKGEGADDIDKAMTEALYGVINIWHDVRLACVDGIEDESYPSRTVVRLLNDYHLERVALSLIEWEGRLKGGDGVTPILRVHEAVEFRSQSFDIQFDTWFRWEDIGGRGHFCVGKGYENDDSDGRRDRKRLQNRITPSLISLIVPALTRCSRPSFTISRVSGSKAGLKLSRRLTIGSSLAKSARVISRECFQSIQFPSRRLMA